MENKDSQYHEVLSELSRYRNGILCGIKNDYHAGKVSQLLDSATRLFEECHKAYQECERAANAMEAANTSANTQRDEIKPCGNMVCEYHAVDSASGCLSFDINQISLCESYYSKA